MKDAVRVRMFRDESGSVESIPTKGAVLTNPQRLAHAGFHAEA